MAFNLQRIRGTSVALLLVGLLLGLWGFTYGEGLGWLGNVPILSARYQIGETVGGVGAFLMGFGLVKLFRHKGDYDDFEEPAKKDGENGSLENFYQAAKKLEQEAREKEP